MRYIIATLLAGTALSIAPAHAQAPADDAAESADIIVIGRGETRQVQELQSEDLAILAAGTSPLKAIAKLPSVNFQSADAFGTYEWSQRISIRGFNQQQLGFTLDGIPLGDASYGNTNGLHISRAIITENIGSVRVTQGAGAVGTNATNNLGGTIQFFSRDPGEALGIDGAVTAGSDRTFRGFARIDSGSMDGVRASLSYAGYTTDKWKGSGVQRSDAINSKILIPVDLATITGMFNYSNRVEQDYQDLNLEMIDRLGYNLDNISDNYALAILLADIGANRNETGAPKLNPTAGTVYPAPYKFVDDVYFDASGLRRDYLGSIGISSPIGEEFTVALKGYYHSNSGQGTWFTPYVPSPTGVPISVRTTEYDIRRTGVFGSFTHDLDWNKLTVTGWYENNDFQQARRFYALGDRTNPGRSARQFQRNPFFTQWEYDFNTQTYQYSIEDLVTFGDLTIALGSKGFAVKNRATPIVAGVLASGTIQSKDWFQPHGFCRVHAGNTGFHELIYGWPFRDDTGRLQCNPQYTEAGRIRHL
jgi:iron complex outermembrane recepter protein